MQKTWEETLLTCIVAVVERVYRPARAEPPLPMPPGGTPWMGPAHAEAEGLSVAGLRGLVVSASTAVPVERE